jgi:hypothetical protein
MRKHLRAVLFSILTGVLAPLVADASYAGYGDPVLFEDLKNTFTASVQTHPGNAAGYYALGRLYTFAAIVNQVGYWTSGNEPHLNSGGPAETIRLREFWRMPGQMTEEQQAYLFDAIRNLTEAVRLMPENGQYWVALGFILEYGSREAPFIAKQPEQGFGVPQKEKREWENEALEGYRAALQVPANNTVIMYSMEAAEGIVHILERRRDLSKKEKREIEQCKETIEKRPADVFRF